MCLPPVAARERWMEAGIGEGAGGGGEAEAGAGGGAGAAGRVRVIPRAWGMSQMRDRAGGRPGMTAVMMAITGSHHVWSRQGVRLPGYITTR